MTLNQNGVKIPFASSTQPVYAYVSYAQADRERALELLCYLNQNGVNIRWDELNPGEFRAAKEISGCAVYIALISPAFAAAKDKHWEWKNVTKTFKKEAILVLIDGDKELFDEFGGLFAQYPLVFDDKDRAMKAMLAKLNHLGCVSGKDVQNAKQEASPLTRPNDPAKHEAATGYSFEPESCDEDEDDAYYPQIIGADSCDRDELHCDQAPSIFTRDHVGGDDYLEPPSLSSPSLRPKLQTQSSPAAGESGAAAIVDRCDFSVISPNKVCRGGYSRADVFMYTKDQRFVVEQALARAPGSSEKDAVTDIKVRQGVTVSVVLECEAKGVELGDWLRSYVWDGDYKRFSFSYRVNEDFVGRQIPFVCWVKLDNFDRFQLRFTVDVTKSARAAERAAKAARRVKIRVVRLRMAFISYSHKDTSSVHRWLSRKAKKEPDLLYWLDTQSLDAGQRWRDEIKRAIDAADKFMLFWSPAAASSQEVEKEWRYALRKKLKGRQFIVPVPLAKPWECPPPKELEHLHFGRPEFNYSAELDAVGFVRAKNLRYLPDAVAVQPAPKAGSAAEDVDFF